MRPQPPKAAQQERGGLEGEQQSKNRTHVCQIVSVREEDGVCTVRDMSGLAEYPDLEIPFQGYSIDGLNSSWLRSMPQANDYVRVTYSPDNTPHIDGYTTPSNFTRRFGGAQLDGYALQRKGAKDDPEGFGGVFRNLKGGEYDCRSRGGAGWTVDRFGQFTAEAGDQTLRLVKKRREVILETDHFDLRANGCRARFGEVKRFLTPLPARTPAKPASVGTLISNPLSTVPTVPGLLSTSREWDLTVGVDTPVTTLLYYQEQAGDLRTDFGAPRPGINTGIPPRYRRLTYGADGLVPNTTLEIDVNGDVTFVQLPTAVIGVTASITNLILAAKGAVSVSSPLIQLGATAAAAIHSSTRADILLVFLKALVTAIGTITTATPGAAAMATVTQLLAALEPAGAPTALGALSVKVD